MIGVNGRFSRKLLCLAVACACASTAFAGPAGPVVGAGSASYNPASLTVTSTTARTQISWQSFNVAASEVLKFVQPNAQSSVLNHVFNPQALNILGGISSNGSVLFMSNGRVFGADVNLDLAGAVTSSLRLPRMALALSGAAYAAQPRPLTTLADGRIYVISQDEQALTSAGGDVLLNPGKTIELANAAMPNLRVGLTAPKAEAINLSRLVGSKGDTGIFAGVFRAPAAARQALERDADAQLTASAQEPAKTTPDMERFYRYALLYARLRSETAQDDGGMMKVAAVSSGRMVLPAARSRPSVLPREIEISTPRAKELALRQISSPLAAVTESSAARLERPAVALAVESEVQGDNTPPLVFASVEPPAEMVATRNAQPVAVAAARAPQTDSAPLLVFASVEPPADMVATRNPQPVAVAVVSAPHTDSPTRLAMAAVEPPAQAWQAQLAQQEAEPATGRQVQRSAPMAVVVALAQHSARPAPQEDSNAKELRIERRAPRYFTDHRGAMFFM